MFIILDCTSLARVLFFFLKKNLCLDSNSIDTLLQYGENLIKRQCECALSFSGTHKISKSAENRFCVKAISSSSFLFTLLILQTEDLLR